MALPKIFAPATIMRIVTLVTMLSMTAALKPSQLSERRMKAVMIRAKAKPTAAASVGVKMPQ